MDILLRAIFVLHFNCPLTTYETSRSRRRWPMKPKTHSTIAIAAIMKTLALKSSRGICGMKPKGVSLLNHSGILGISPPK